MPNQPVMQAILSRPAMPLNTLCQPPYRVTPSVDTQVVPKARKALSKSLTTAMRMLMATMTKGKALNQCERPILPQEYFSIMKPMQPAVAAYTLA